MATKVIGFRVPEDSTLPLRLKALAYRLKMQHGDLLERWLTLEETGSLPTPTKHKAPEQLPITDNTTTLENNAIKRIEAQLNELTKQLNKQAGRLKNCENFLNAADSTAPVNTSNSQSNKHKTSNKFNSAKTRPTTPQIARPNRTSDATIKRILELAAEGMGSRNIAKRLNEEGIPTATGGDVWNFGTIAKILRRCADK